MGDEPASYSSLSPDQQAAVSVWIEGFQERFGHSGAAALEQTLGEAPEPLRAALLVQLLPLSIDQYRQQHGVSPTLHDLRLAHPNLASELNDAYSRLPPSYQLPVELNGYRVIRVVGDGGQAVVLRAQDDVHSTVAIKLSTSARHNELLLRERRLLGECEHPGIVSVIGSGVYENRAYFIMPYLKGATLADRYGSHAPEASEAARIGVELCDIVEHLHRQGILHRDIKPANVWIDDHGAVKLIDLGMAIERSRWGQPHSEIREFHGTPAFMSPEQAGSDGERDGELSDVFSIGATLYWLGTGSPPFDGASGNSVLGKAAVGQFDQDRLAATSGWPKDLVAACHQAMANDPGERPRSAASLANILYDAADVKRSRRVRGLAAACFVSLMIAASLALTWDQSHWPLPLERRHVAAKPVTGLSSEPAAATPIVGSPSSGSRSIKAADWDAYTPADFNVTVACPQRLVEPWGPRGRTPAQRPELRVETPTRLAGDTAWEVRVGDLPWKGVIPAETDGTFRVPLAPAEAAHHGPVQLRPTATEASGSPSPAQPLHFDLDIARSLAEDSQAFTSELIHQAKAAECFNDTPTGWAMSEDYSRRFGLVVAEFYFTDTPGTAGKAVVKELHALLGSQTMAGSVRPRFELKQAFALVSKDIQDSLRLWTNVRFIDGSTTGAKLHKKPMNDTQESRLRVEDWCESLGKDTAVAKFTPPELSLTRLNEILSDLTYIHVWSESNYPVPRGAGAGADKQKDFVTRPTSEVIYDVDRLSDSRTLRVPRVWSPLYLKGRLQDGSFTPTFKVFAPNMVCASPLIPIASSPGLSRLETYIFIADNQIETGSPGLIPYLRDEKRLQERELNQHRRTHLLLEPVLPPGAVKAEYYTDKSFTKPWQLLKPGVFYARYTDHQGATIGSAAYRLTENEFAEWVDHAIKHAEGAD